MFDRLFHALAARLVTLSLFQKLAIKTLCIALIPLVLASVFFLHIANDIIMQETQVSNQRAFLQTVALLNNDLMMNKRALTTFASTPQVIETLAEDPAGQTAYEQMMGLRALTTARLIINLTDSVYRMRVYVPDAFLYARQRVDTFPLSEIQNEAWYADIGRRPFVYIPPREEFFIYNDTREVFSIAVSIQAYEQSSETMAVAMLDLDTDVIRATLEAQVMDSGNRLGIVHEGQLLLLTGLAEGDSPFDASLLAEIQQARAQGSEMGGIRFGAWYVQWAELEIPDWFMVEAIPGARMEDGKRQLLLQMALFIPVVTALVIMATLLTSRSFTSRIQRMARAVHAYAAGQRDTRLTVGSSDVLGGFEQDLNLLFDRTNQLMNDHYRLGQQARTADMNALQSQINPHFLYNTLDMLYWMSKNGEAESLQDIIVTLSGFYRKSLARGREVVTLRDEIEHVRLYLSIQNQRFGGTIHAQWTVPDSLLDVPVMKLTLQPVVENAVQHGIRHMLPETGEIRVTARREGEDLLICIADNGSGMPQAQASALTRGDLGPSGAEGGSGYGIHNVQRRLRLMYGEAYGLTYESVAGLGTTVVVRIPVQGACTYAQKP